jgi:phage gp16-like protein
MPAGYERLRDALMRKGKSEEEAKSMAAAIWNKHHKDNPVTNKPHKKELSVVMMKTRSVGKS